ncbi:hypothetical protein BU17DRAFT_72778 [Hysterangium stoloniferum]|nr:hypothetical protein BU17DRAFT_72778 [Hysterangium stoloniferum]
MTITIYDIPRRTGRSLNPLCMRIKAILNYKGIPYRTEWVEYPDISATLRKIGAAPTSIKPDGSPDYTVPVISDPDHPTEDGSPNVISNSWKIAEYLDEMYPTSGVVFPRGTKSLQFLFDEHLSKSCIAIITPAFVIKTYHSLQDGSQAYFRQSRETLFKKKLEEISPEGSEEWNEAWKNVEKAFADLALILDKNGKDSQFVLGDTISYEDFVLASVFYATAILMPEKWEEMKHWHGGRWAIARENCLPYFEKV